MARVADGKHVVRVFDQLPEPGLERMRLLAMLVVGSEKREYVASHSPVGGLDARHRVRPDARRDRDRSGRDVDLLRIALPLPMTPRDIQQLFGVRPRSLAELARETR